EAVVPGDASLDKMAIGQDLDRRPRTVVIVPADVTDELLVVAISPQAKFVRLDSMDPELDGVAGPAPLRPGVAKQAIRKQTKVHRPGIRKRGLHALGAEARLAQADLIVAGGKVRIDRARGRGTGDDPRTVRAAQLNQNVGQGGVILVTDIAQEHDPTPNR